MYAANNHKISHWHSAPGDTNTKLYFPFPALKVRIAHPTFFMRCHWMEQLNQSSMDGETEGERVEITFSIFFLPLFVTRRTNFNYFRKTGTKLLCGMILLSHSWRRDLYFCCRCCCCHRQAKVPINWYASHSEGLSGFYRWCLWLFSTSTRENQFASESHCYWRCAIKPSTPL